MYNNTIGVIYPLKKLLVNGAEQLVDLGVETVQIVNWENDLLTRENALKALEILSGKVRITSFWAGWSGPKVWDHIDGPLTLGIVPEVFRYQRMQELIRGAEFAAWLGVRDMATHAGFIPESPSYPEYRGILNAVKNIAGYCKAKGIYFNFETGQETPVTLMRLITDTGMDNLGINLDPANLILYGRGNPVDALDIFKEKIRGVHVKDGDYTTDFHKNGKERVVGEGSVNFPVFLPKLLKQGYTGDLYIERETSGEQQLIDIRKTITYLRDMMACV
ncbi:MAG: sugar phosphate isomerase/epimerase [Eubacteriales bacterium]|nr:sugar phosphate isomerase/epimerase [Eubacteriales bacterium]